MDFASLVQKWTLIVSSSQREMGKGMVWKRTMWLKASAETVDTTPLFLMTIRGKIGRCKKTRLLAPPYFTSDACSFSMAQLAFSDINIGESPPALFLCISPPLCCQKAWRAEGVPILKVYRHLYQFSRSSFSRPSLVRRR